ncbi:MAG: hypothetical protein BMS9Abin17_1626 [Acidimicrobiia bacterium]|nr:MAG: hypothetical protein BMS9Abin17_1626 [Acidimicrobiia bacterium]
MGTAAIGQLMHSDRGNPGASASHNTGYRIDKIGSEEEPWVVGLDDPGVIPLGLFSRDFTKAYPTRRLACAAEAHLEVLRERRIKFVRHVVLATVWAVAAVVAYIVMAAPGQPFQVEWFVVAFVAAFFFLSETLEGFLVVIDEGWDRFYEIRRVTRTDRFIARVVFHPFSRRGRPYAEAESPRVRVIDES